MTRAEVVSALAKGNPKRRPDCVQMYADQFVAYAEAAVNIAANGNLVVHPRTGSPIPNPYLSIRASSMTAMKRLPTMDAAALWDHLGRVLSSAIPDQPKE